MSRGAFIIRCMVYKRHQEDNAANCRYITRKRVIYPWTFITTGGVEQPRGQKLKEGSVMLVSLSLSHGIAGGCSRLYFSFVEGGLLARCPGSLSGRYISGLTSTQYSVADSRCAHRVATLSLLSLQAPARESGGGKGCHLDKRGNK